MTPRVARIVETALYVRDTARSADFYERALGMKRMAAGDRLVPMDAGGGTVLLLFLEGAAADGSRFDGGWIPPHDGRGQAHFAVAIEADDVDAWREHLTAEGIEIESEVRWGRGGLSLYFRDPDGHSVELATPGMWPAY